MAGQEPCYRITFTTNNFEEILPKDCRLMNATFSTGDHVFKITGYLKPSQVTQVKMIMEHYANTTINCPCWEVMTNVYKHFNLANYQSENCGVSQWSTIVMDHSYGFNRGFLMK